MTKVPGSILALLVGVILILVMGYLFFGVSITSQPIVPDLSRSGAAAVELSGDTGPGDDVNIEDIAEETTVPVQAVPRPVIQETNGIKHTVSLNEIIGGGPAKDGIPSIDDPQFISPEEAAEDLSDQEPGIALSLGGVDRFYPFQILVWHEIVNDTLGGQRALVTYCPLCFSGIVFDPLVDDERVEFGTSGKLWQSNLVMYDRKTDSYWSQILGEAIVGEQAGESLPVISSDLMRFGDWKAAFPQGEVLSRDTGAIRIYGSDPYGDYYTRSGSIVPVRNSDSRLADKDFILGLVVDGQAKAYFPPAIKAKGEIIDSFAGKTIVARYNSSLDVVQLFEKQGSEEVRLNPFPNFWFSWVAAHPDTSLYK